MALIADGLLIAAALAAALYCHVLALRLRKLREMDGGVGAAIAAMSKQVEEMRAALAAARAVSGESTRSLGETTARAEMAAGRLELLLAAIHDRNGTRPLDLAGRRSAGRGAPSGPGAGGGGATEAVLETEPRTPATTAAGDLAGRLSAHAGDDGVTERPALDADGPSARRQTDDAAVRPAAPAPDAPITAMTGLLTEVPRVAPARDAARPFVEAAPMRAVAGGGRRGVGEAAALRTALEALAREGER